MLKLCSGVTNKKEKDEGYKRSGQTLVRGAESDKSSAMCYMSLIDLNESICWERAHPLL